MKLWTRRHSNLSSSSTQSSSPTITWRSTLVSPTALVPAADALSVECGPSLRDGEPDLSGQASVSSSTVHNGQPIWSGRSSESPAMKSRPAVRDATPLRPRPPRVVAGTPIRTPSALHPAPTVARWDARGLAPLPGERLRPHDPRRRAERTAGDARRSQSATLRIVAETITNAVRHWGCPSARWRSAPPTGGRCSRLITTGTASRSTPSPASASTACWSGPRRLELLAASEADSDPVLPKTW